jgi:hypothetical protein
MGGRVYRSGGLPTFRKRGASGGRAAGGLARSVAGGVIGGSASVRIKDLGVKMTAQKNEFELFKHDFLLKSNCFVDKK